MPTTLLLTLAALAPAAEPVKYPPTADYATETVAGFTVLIHPELLKHKDEAAEARKELEKQLKEIEAVVPEGPFKAIKKVRFWMEWEAKPNGAAEFHPSAGWLKANGYNPLSSTVGSEAWNSRDLKSRPH